MHKLLLFCLTMTVFALQFPNAAWAADCEQPPDPGDPLVMITRDMQAAKAYYETVHNYEALIEMQEFIDGELRDIEIMYMVFTKQPYRMYCRWEPGSLFEGMQASYDAERDGQDRFKALESGFRGIVGVLNLKFDSLLVTSMYPHHYPMKEYDYGTQFRYAFEIYDKSRELGKYRIDVGDVSSDVIPGRRLQMYEVLLTDKPGEGLQHKRLVLGFDEQTRLPLLIQFYDFEDRLYASYKFLEFKPNIEADDSIFELKKLPK